MLETPLRWWQQLYGKGSCVISFTQRDVPVCQNSYTTKQQLYVQIIHAETKHASLCSQLRQLPWRTWVIKYIFRNWPQHPCSNHQPVFFIIWRRRKCSWHTYYELIKGRNSWYRKSPITIPFHIQADVNGCICFNKCYRF